MKHLTCKCLFLLFLQSLAAQAADFEALPEFEKGIVQKALNNQDLSIDLKPQGKQIRHFYFFTEKPFRDEDKLLSWLDKISFRTQDRALKAQLWVQKGESFDWEVITQNEQLLLNPAVRNFALIFPVQPKKDLSKTEVDLLIVSKDIFSWQTDFALSGSGGSLSKLILGISQTNLLGLNKTLGLSFVMDQQLINLATYYIDPIFLDSKNRLEIHQGFYFNKDAFKYEGLNGVLNLSYPLLVESEKWGYNLSFSYIYKPVFDFQGNQIRKFEGQKRQYKKLYLNPQATVTRSFGTTNKNNLSWGYGLELGRYDPIEPVNQAFRDQVLPKDELESYLILQYQFFQNKFLTLSDYNTYSMTEWLQLGPSIIFSNNLGLKFLGSDNYFYRPKIISTTSVAPSKDSFLSLTASWQTRIQDRLINNQASGILLAISPDLFKLGRLVGDASYSQVWDNLDNSLFVLGSETGLRAVPIRYYQGDKFLRTNLEFRTRSIPFWITRLGLVAFYDFGAAFTSKSDFRPTHDLGLGIRILMVPWNRKLIRIDFATPVAGPLKGFHNTLISFGFGQAF